MVSHFTSEEDRLGNSPGVTQAVWSKDEKISALQSPKLLDELCKGRLKRDIPKYKIGRCVENLF